MTYSSALFSDEQPWREQRLEDAQRAKIEAVLDAAGVREGTRVLEIGSGWGALAIAAARRGAHVHSITVSPSQAQWARERVASAGLSELVTVELCDYREVTGTFDAVVSVEMIEAVGEEFWPTYFQAIDSAMAPGGVAVVQAILMDHDRYLATRNSYGWIQKYIFPGGLIPSAEAIHTVTREFTSLHVTRTQQFGQSYAHTLRRWRERFLDRWDEVQALGFDERFRRMWEFYLAYCEAGFASGYLDVAHFTFTRRTA